VTPCQYAGSELRRSEQAAQVIQRSATVLVFGAAALLLWWLYGNRLILGTNDEGIYLDAAERILHGQQPYRDFFGYMSPGSFWIHALVFRLFGTTLAAARSLVVLYAALECALVYWLVARFASPGCALATTFLFFAFETSDASRMTAQHRWDSAAFSLAAIALCTGALIDRRRLWFAVSGALMVLAAIATPSMALLGVITLVWLVWQRELRPNAAWFLSGMLAAATLFFLALCLNGILGPLAAQMAWLSKNYSIVNGMPYGSIVGGYRALFDGVAGWELGISAWLVFCMALPAVLPIVSLAGGAAFLLCPLQRNDALRSVLPYLMLCIAALVISIYPRADVEHLSFVAPLPYAVAGILAYRWVPTRLRAWLTLWMAVWAVAFFAVGAGGLRGQEVRTPVGNIRANVDDGRLVSGLLERVHPGDSLFVYPYKPLLYFLTQGENPTRYSYVQPGLMTPQDAALALADLKRKPPQWVIYLDLDPVQFERVWPAAAGHDLHFQELEAWIKGNYRASDLPPITGYVLMQRQQ